VQACVDPGPHTLPQIGQVLVRKGLDHQ
jgi:hypothetical protein